MKLSKSNSAQLNTIQPKVYQTTFAFGQISFVLKITVNTLCTYIQKFNAHICCI